MFLGASGAQYGGRMAEADGTGDMRSQMSQSVQPTSNRGGNNVSPQIGHQLSQ